MQALRTFIFCAPLALSGCSTGIAMMAMNGFGACSPKDFQKAQYEMGTFQTLYIGQRIVDVARYMGLPDRTRRIATQEGQAEVWEYHMGAEHCRGTEETTGLVVTQNGVVQGIGPQDYRRLKVASFSSDFGN